MKIETFDCDSCKTRMSENGSVYSRVQYRTSPCSYRKSYEESKCDEYMKTMKDDKPSANETSEERKWTILQEGSSVDKMEDAGTVRHCFPFEHHENSRDGKRKFGGNKLLLNNPSTINPIPHMMEHAIEPPTLTIQSPESISPSSSTLSSSLPSSSFLPLPPRGTAMSLPPSPLLQDAEKTATSMSLSSLIERRRSKPGQKHLIPLSLFNGQDGESNFSPNCNCHHKSPSLVSKYDHPSSDTKDDTPLKTTPPILSSPFPVRVLPNLYLGNSKTSADLHCLRRHDISYIVNVTSDISNSFENEPGFSYLRIPIADDSWSQDMESHFQSAINFIDEGRRKNSSVLIHCMAGVSRSVTITVAYLMKSENLSMDDAYDLLKGCKSNINPNLSLMGQLQLFGEKLKRERRQLQHLLDLSNLSICQAAMNFSETGKSISDTSITQGTKIYATSLSSDLITPETATFFGTSTDSLIFNFPCTPPPTPSLLDSYGAFQNCAMSISNGKEIEDL